MELSTATAILGQEHRLQYIMSRGLAGEQFSISFLGGSITHGCAATDIEKSYARRVFHWFQNKFPKCQINYHNGAIGGTDSIFGLHRVEEDLLIHNEQTANLVFVEFSVNDIELENEKLADFYQALLLKLLLKGSLGEAAVSKNQESLLINGVMGLNTMEHKDGRNRQTLHNQVAEQLQIPVMSIRNYLWPQIEMGLEPYQKYSEDSTHPNDHGHQLLADILIYRLEQIYEHLETACQNATLESVQHQLLEVVKTEKHELRANYLNPYVDAKRLMANQVIPIENIGWKPMLTQHTKLDAFHEMGWQLDGPKEQEAKLTFEIEAASIFIQYRKTIDHQTGKIRVVVDHQEDQAMIVDGHFENGWGTTVDVAWIVNEACVKKHHIEIQALSDEQMSYKEFQITSILVAHLT